MIKLIDAGKVTNLVSGYNCWFNYQLLFLRITWEINYGEELFPLEFWVSSMEHATMSRMFILAWTGLHRANNEMQIEIIPGLLWIVRVLMTA